jgi:hypothetical protein
VSAPHSDREVEALVDRLLLELGRLDPLELLLAADLLPYEDYEAWRMGRKPEIQAALRVAPGDAAELLECAARYARGQKLAETPLEHRGWGGLDVALRIGSHASLVRGCAASFAPPPDRPQLDLFQDSSALLLEEEIGRALAERRTERAREMVARLMAQDSGHPRLHGFLRLIQTIDDAGALSPKVRLRELEAIEPLARELLGHRSRDFLAPLWTALAESLAGRAFDPGTPRLHAAFAWERAGRWDAVCHAVQAQPDWRGQPLLLLAHAQACWRRRDLAAARRDWMWLCWEHPLDAERAFIAPQLPDRRLADLWGAFGDLDPALPTEDFPAWLLLREPGAAASVPPDSAPPDERGAAYRLLCRLVGGEDDIDLRRELAEVHPELLRLYLARRG